MSRILIDCGAARGKSIAKLNNRYGPFDQIYAFECDLRAYLQLIKSTDNKTKCINAAAWIKDGRTKFYESQNIGSSSLHSDKTSGNLNIDDPYVVATVDLNKFIDSLSFDYLCVKLDVEGAEYNILPHLINNGSINQINTLCVEWHWRRIKSVSKAKHKELFSKLQECSAEIVSWR